MQSAKKAFLVVVVATALATRVTAAPIPEIVVVASQFRDTELVTAPVSMTVLDPEEIGVGSLQHFEELSALVPNLNWSGEGSRARYFQIRGTGELEQYEGAPNPSVGFLVDDIDLSDIGGVATTFDTARIEVLRGPQGTRYGANALAGLIYVQTADPTTEPLAKLSVTGGTDDIYALGGVMSGPVSGFYGDELTYRLAIQQYGSNGFRDNAFLGRDDTSQQDELTARAKLHWQPTPDMRVNLTAFHIDLDNGYDDFAIDNGFTTFSDAPGEDSQETDAAAIRATYSWDRIADLVSITGVARSDIVYSFDADWGNDAFWAPFVYDYTQRFDRQRDTVNQEFRLVSGPDARLFGADWVVGAWLLELDESSDRADRGEFCEPGPCAGPSADRDAFSDYEATNIAVFGQLGIPVTSRAELAVGLRFEQREADFSETTVNRLQAPATDLPECVLTGSDSQRCRVSARDHLWGGEVTLTQTISDTVEGWGRVARGYKAGGFNPSLTGIVSSGCTNPAVTPEQLEFSDESLWNYELGLRFFDPARAAWTADVSVFTQQRDDLQIKVPVQCQLGDPATFFFFTDNGEEGRTTGLELATTWQPVDVLTLGATFGLLDTEIEEFAARPDLNGRDFAHAPRYTFAVNATWRAAAGWFARVDYAGKDGYFIDYCQAADCNDPETGAFQVLDLRAGREWGAWSAEAWWRNVLDEEYAVRGFYFGNEPPAFEQTLYTRLGDPRHAGVTVTYRFQ